MTFKIAANLWFEDKRHYVRTSTAAAYRFIMIRHLMPVFGDKVAITENDVQQFILESYEKGLSRNYIKGMLNVLKMILRFGERNGLDADMKMEVHMQSETRARKLVVFSQEEQKILMKYLKANFNYLNVGIYMSLAFGLRIGEVCAMKWRDIDIKSGVISVNKTLQRIYSPEETGSACRIITGPPKSLSSIREIPMTDEFIRLVAPLKKDVKPSSYVISGTSKPIEPRSYRMHYKSILRGLNISDVKFHGLRHSFATRCIDCRCDYKTISSILGHTSISTTLNLYVHPNIDQKRECLEKMADMLEDG